MMHSIVQYALVILGLLASLVLYLSMNREVRRNAMRNRQRMEELAGKISLAPVSVPAPAPVQETVYIPHSVRPGLNVSKRVHAMRMVRRNEDVSHIAVALGVSRREVELLIRVQKLSAASIVNLSTGAAS